MSLLHRIPVIIIGIWLLATLFWWGLAFFPTQEVSPEWLLAARDVCFNTMENGLPGPSGWMLLIFGPLSFLGVFVVAWPGELKRSLQAAVASKSGRIILLLAASALVIEAQWVSKKVSIGLRISNFDFSQPSSENMPESYPRTFKVAPDFTLIDQHGKHLQLSSLKGENLILTFAFAHCQTVCPVLVKHSLDAIKELDSTGLRVLIITLDPWRDTPKSLPFLAKKWELPGHAHVLSGAIQEVTAVLDQYKVTYIRNEKTGEVDHPALTYVISAEGEIAYTFNNAPASWLSEAIKRITGEKDVALTRQSF